MPANELDQMLFDSAVEVVESMFFTSLAGDAEPSAASTGPWISARLTFHGDPSGRFGVRTPTETGRKIASSFLGLEESAVTEAQTGEVICELANMLCGSVLSNMEKETSFELAHPELDPPETGSPEGYTASRVFGLEEGPLTVWLELEQAR